MSIPPRTRSRLSRTFHRLSLVLGLGVTAWVVFGYLGTKMREARIRLVKEREKTERIKQHFTSTISNITFTVYALLPTLSTQILEELKVEALTEELQNLASKGKSNNLVSSSEGETPSLASSVTQDSDSQAEPPASTRPDHLNPVGNYGSNSQGIGASWASEFVASQQGGSPQSSSSGFRHSEENTQSQDPTILASPAPQPYNLQSDVETDMSTSMSNITESSLASTSPGRGSGPDLPQSPESRYLRSPSRSPRRNGRRLRDAEEEEGERTGLVGGSTYAEVVKAHIPEDHPGQAAEGTQDEINHTLTTPSVPVKTKAQLWGEIKTQAITRTIMAVYLVPLLTLHTTSQLTLLARLHHLQTLASLNNGTREGSAAKIGGLSSLNPLNYFSLESMGLEEFDTHSDKGSKSWTGTIASGVWSAGTATASYLLGSGTKDKGKTRAVDVPLPLHARIDEDTERAFLCTSWWLLHVGWKELQEQVEAAVGKVFKPISLKKELTVQDWLEKLDSVKAHINRALTTPSSGKDLSSFHDVLYPPADVSRFTELLQKHGLTEECPIPEPPYVSPLSDLLNQSASHIASPNFDLVFSLCVARMQTMVLDRLASQVYEEVVLLDPLESFARHEQAKVESMKGKRLVECLPFLTNWSRNVWAKVPDEAIERTMGLPELEGFAALIYGDLGNGLEAGH